MKNQEQLMQLLTDSLNATSFIERYKEMSQRHNEHNYDLLQQRNDKKVILGILKDLGYKFTYFPHERIYSFAETVDDLEFKTGIKITSGICTLYLGVLYRGEYINARYTNLGFLYRYLIHDMGAPITAPKFKDHEEFRAIARSVMNLFEDLKKEFLRASKLLPRTLV